MLWKVSPAKVEWLRTPPHPTNAQLPSGVVCPSQVSALNIYIIIIKYKTAEYNGIVVMAAFQAAVYRHWMFMEIFITD